MDQTDKSSLNTQITPEYASLPVSFDEQELELSITARFEHRVQIHPTAIAIKSHTGSWQYDELNRRANQIARTVQQHQAQADCPVALVFEHDATIILAMLAVLKTGKTYVVLNPSDPQTRLKQQLEDFGATLLLTASCSSLLANSLIDDSVYCLNLDELDTNEADHNLPQVVQPDTVATIFFTSGSTGKPKGVTRTHRQMLFRSWVDTQDCQPRVNDAVSHLYFNNAAASAADAYFALLNGATLCPFNVQRHTVEQWAAWLRDERIRYLHPSIPLFRLLLDTTTENLDLPHLRYLSLAGQRLHTQDVERFRACFPSTCKLIHRFSASEASVITRLIIDHETPLTPNGVVPIGYPVPGKRVFIADEQGKELPAGGIGEICVQSRYLSPGYWRNATQTNSQFIEDPSGIGPRIYRTGDQGSARADGCLEHHGRKDFMVKIRGFRVELEAIDGALMNLPDISDAVVIAHELPDASHRLVAYVVRTGGNATSHDIPELRKALAQTMPEYMVPSVYVPLDTLPLTDTGKVDRAALPQADLSDILSAEDYRAPVTETEERLASIWSTLLGVEQVGLDDNFFELGGHSLLAIRMISRIRETLSVEIPLRWLIESPTVGSLSVRIELLQSEDFLECASGLLPTSMDNNKELSHAQERLWFLDQLDGASALYNMHYGLRLRGTLDVQAIERALQQIVERHEVLRTAIVADTQGRPYQQIMRTVPKLGRVSVQGSAEQCELSLQRLLIEQRMTPFDLSAGLKIRATLFEVSRENVPPQDSEYVLLIMVHHIASDGWSMGVFRKELGALYNANCMGLVSELPALPIQYSDFAIWQREWLDDQVMGRQLEYWKQQLSGAPALLELPTDHPRPAVQRFRGSSYRFDVSAQLCDRLRALGQNSGATLYMALLSAFSVLLSRYSAQDDIVVGSPIANRTRVEIEPLIGFFVNTLVLRTDLSGGVSFEQLLDRVRETTLSAYQHQDMPFEKVVEALQPTRSMSYSPLFQVMFVLQNTPGETLSLDGLSAEPMDIGEQSGQAMAKFDLTLSVVEQREGLSARLSYNTDLFEAATIERMAGHFQCLLEGIVADPNCLVSHLPLLSAAERQQMLVGWNDTRADIPQDQCLHELFEAQVERTPDATALELDEQQLSYRELNERANQLGHFLIESAVIKPGDFVGICLERSFEMIVSMLAVLKVGGVYIPLDPYLPGARLSYMLNDSGNPLLLTQKKWESTLTGTAAKRLYVDTIAERLVSEPQSNLSLELSPVDLAYMIYTSGSTGEPKGTMITHRNLGNYFHWRQSSGLITSTDRVLQRTTLSFDVASSEIFAPLLIGATVVLAPADIRNDLDALARLVVDQNITHLHVPPSYLRLLIENADFVRDNRIIRLFSGGEEMNVSLRNRTLEQLDAHLLNGYGPTETTIAVLFHDSQQSDPGQTVPIGRSVANTQIYVLDKHQQMVPAGHMGELYIGGECVGAGYFKRAELTAERFIDNPFGSGRLYKSGDLVRYLPTGNGIPPEVEFLGRTDNQVKVRGFRVELGEIEAALDKHTELVESVVIYQNDTQFQRLIAYIVGDEQVASNELREFLSGTLPEYMVPSVYIQLESFPLTHNGKVDRAALPRADLVSVLSAADFEAPVTETEQKLVANWSTLLGVERVGRHDNFFDLGGHSLLAVKMVSAIQVEFSIDVPLRLLFEQSTLQMFAEAIDNIDWLTVRSSELSVEDGEEGEL